MGLLPFGALLAGLFVLWRREFERSRPALVFAVAAIALYLAALVDLYVRLPIYSTAKSTYTLGLLPCYAILIAAGAAPLLRTRIGHGLAMSALACWATAAYVAYFSVL